MSDYARKNLHGNYNITILEKNKEVKHISCPAGSNLLEAMRENNMNIVSTCAGRGFCGKCKIRLLFGTLEVTSEDERFFTKTQLTQGLRLACRAYPTDNCVIEIIDYEADFEVVTDYLPEIDAMKLTENMHTKNKAEDKDYAIAIDIGTTTVVISLVNICSGKIINTYSAVNPQRAYGADVISRICAANNGKQKLLQELIRSELLRGIYDLVEKSGIDKVNICKLAIACNTTMGHLLLGFSCEGLGSYPYIPVDISAIERPFSYVFDSDYIDAPVIIMPGISTFVGGDIAAGPLACGFDKSDKPSLFLDLGTNGEMALGNRDRILVTSSAAGPAFEGGNISCGVGSIAGAICNVDIIDDKTYYRTIGDKEAVGICGTGIIELTSELLDAGIIDETGLLIDKYFNEGFPIDVCLNNYNDIFYFTQKDIRQLQMAKAAIRAGIDILIKEYGISYDDLDKVYIAGGFGLKLNLHKAVNIGLLPKKLYDKIIPVGNSALRGAISYLIEPDAPVRIESIVKAAVELQLSEQEEFNDLYLEYMYFR